MTQDGLPHDYSEDSRFPGRMSTTDSSPTLGPLPSSSRHSPVPSSSHHTAVPSSSSCTPVPSSSPHAPVLSSSHLTLFPPTSVSPHPQAVPSPSSFTPPPLDHDVVLRILRQKTFQTALKPTSLSDSLVLSQALTQQCSLLAVYAFSSSKILNICCRKIRKLECTSVRRT